MAKKADVELRIVGKDLSSKPIEKVAEELQSLIAAQERLRQSATTSSTAIKSFETDLKSLEAVSREMAARRNVIENLLGKRGELDKKKQELNALRTELAELLSIRQRGTFLGDIETPIRNLRKAVSGAERDFNRAASGVERLENRLSGIGVDAANAEDELRRLIGVQDQIVVAQTRARGAIDETNVALARTAQRTREAAAAEQRRQAELAETIRRQQELARMQQDSRAAFTLGRDQALARDAAIRMLEVNRRADAVEARLAATRSRLGTATRSLASDTNRAAVAQDRFGDSSRTALSVYQRLRGQVLSLAAAYFGVFEAINIGVRSIQTDIARQGALIRLQVVEQGDLAAAAEEFQYIREEADRLGQAFGPLVNQYSKFRIAVEGAGETAEVARKTFADFAEAGTVLMLSQDEMDGIFRALEQSFSKGTIQAEELRGQLGDRLPGAFTKLATAIGVSTAELNELLREGRVSAKLLPLLGEMLADEVASQLPEATRNTRAELAKLRSAFEDFLDVIADSGFSETIRQLSIELRQFFNSEEGKQFAQDIAQAFAVLVNAARTLISALGGPSGLLFWLKAIVAITFAKWGGQAVAALGGMARQIRATTTAMRLASVSARNMGRAFGLALGPIGVIATLAAEAFFYFQAKAEAAAIAAEEHAEQLEELATASGQALDAAVALAEQQEKNETADYDAARAAREKAQADLEVARASLKRAMAEQSLYARGKGAPSALMGQLMNQVKQLETDIEGYDTTISRFEERRAAAAQARVRLERESVEANKRGYAEVEEFRRKLEDKGFVEQLRKDEELRNEFVRKWREVEKELADIPRDLIDASLEDRARAVDSALARIRAEALGGDNLVVKDAEDKKEEQARERRLRLARQTKDALLAIEGEIASAQIESNVATFDQIDKNLQLRLAEIDRDIQQRLLDLQELKRRAQEDGTPESVATADLAIARVAEYREIEEAQARQNAATEKAALLEQRFQNILAQRDLLLENLNTKQELGLLTQNQATQKGFEIQEQYQGSLIEAANAWLEFLRAQQAELAKSGINVDLLIQQVQNLKTEIETLPDAWAIAQERVSADVAGGLTDAFATLAEGIAGAIQGANSLSEAFSNAGNAFLSFLADFLVGLGKAIMQAVLLEAILRALGRGSGGSFWDIAVGAVAGTAHTGGMVGSPRHSYREVSPLAFAGAPRYHNGGFPGLRADEVPIIAQRGEEVLSRADPRNALNGGGTKPADVKIVNAIDSASMVSEALNTRDGQQPVVNMIRARKREIRTILGV